MCRAAAISTCNNYLAIGQVQPHLTEMRFKPPSTQPCAACRTVLAVQRPHVLLRSSLPELQPASCTMNVNTGCGEELEAGHYKATLGHKAVGNQVSSVLLQLMELFVIQRSASVPQRSQIAFLWAVFIFPFWRFWVAFKARKEKQICITNWLMHICASARRLSSYLF